MDSPMYALFRREGDEGRKSVKREKMVRNTEIELLYGEIKLVVTTTKF